MKKNKTKFRLKKILFSVIGVFVFAFSFALTNFNFAPVEAQASSFGGAGLENISDSVPYNKFFASKLPYLSNLSKLNIFKTPSNKVFYSYKTSSSNVNHELNFVTQNWDGISFGDSFLGQYTWSNGVDTFYSEGTKQQYFNESTYRWPVVTWSGLPTNSFYGDMVVFVNNKNFLLSDTGFYLLDGYTWRSIAIGGLPSNRESITPTNFFVFNDTLYLCIGVSVGSGYVQRLYSFDDTSYIFTEVVVSSDSFFASRNFNAYNIWSDNLNTYYTVANDTYIINDDLTHTFNNFYGDFLDSHNIGVDGLNIFSLNGFIYIIDSNNSLLWVSSYNIYNLGYQNGYDAGYNAGYIAGLNNSSTSDSYDAGYQNGYNAGIATNSGYQSGYDTGYSDGYNVGYSAGSDASYSSGYSAGSFDGYNNGYNAGLEAGSDYSFLGLIGAVIDAPIKAFTGLFDFELFGTNLKSFFLALFTACVIIVIVKICLGGR